MRTAASHLENGTGEHSGIGVMGTYDIRYYNIIDNK